MNSRLHLRHLLQMMTLLGLISISGCVALDNVMANIFGRSMRNSASFDPYENPLMPPEGSIPFSAANFPAGPGQLNLGQVEGFGGMYPDITQAALTGADPERGAIVNAMINPVSPDARSLARGEVLFQRNCAPCHGASGLPTDAPILPVWGYLAAFPLTSAAAIDRTDGYIFGMISVGRGAMPAYGQRISYWDRWDVVNYLRTLQGVAPSGGTGAAPAGGAEVDSASVETVADSTGGSGGQPSGPGSQGS